MNEVNTGVDTKIVWGIAAGLVLTALGVFSYVYFYPRTVGEVTPFTTNEVPTDFSRVGYITFAEDKDHVLMRLVYEEPGKPALTKELILDPLSVCATETGAAPCTAMSISLDIPLQGARAFVEGIEQVDGTVLVRKLQKVVDGQPLLPASGRIFIAWPQAVSLIEECRASMVVQSHSLDVALTLKDGQQVVAVEPVIDEVFSVTERAQEACGPIGVATE